MASDGDGISLSSLISHNCQGSVQIVYIGTVVHSGVARFPVNRGLVITMATPNTSYKLLKIHCLSNFLLFDLEI